MEYIAKYFEGSYDKTLFFITKVGLTFAPGFLLVFAVNRPLFLELEAWQLLPLSVVLSFVLGIAVTAGIVLSYAVFHSSLHVDLQPIRREELPLYALATALVSMVIFIGLLRLGDLHVYGNLFAHAVVAGTICVPTGICAGAFIAQPKSARVFALWFVSSLPIGLLALGMAIYQVQGLRL